MDAPAFSAAALVYHERQDAALCAVHALNSLVQGPCFTAADLANIALELDSQERELMLANGTETEEAIMFAAADSSNVDDSGNYSIGVIDVALRRAFGLSVTPVSVSGGADVLLDVNAEEAFLCNHSEHWFTLRQLYGIWFNLNSLLRAPEIISPTHLSLFLSQLQHEGYSIFVVRGSFPEPIRDVTLGQPGSWHEVADIRSVTSRAARRPAGRATGSADRSTDAELERALAASLASALADSTTASRGSVEGGVGSGGGAAATVVSDDDDDDDALQLAMAMSMSANQT